MKIKVIYFICFVLALFCWYIIFHNDSKWNSYRCKTKKMEIKGIITDIVGRGGYRSIRVNNAEFVSFEVSTSYKYRKGFDRYHYFAIGDSISKITNSDEVII